MSKTWFFAALLAAIGCGGRDGPVGVEAIGDAASDGAAPAGALFQALYPQEQAEGGELSVSFNCLERALPVGTNGLPNCIVVSAQLPAGRSEQEIADCRRCSAPGFAPFVASMPLERIGEGLSDYACICAVSPVARDVPCPPNDSSAASWCYSGAGSGPSGRCLPRPGPILGFSGDAIAHGPLYVACFEPSATR